jgi:hypothetical protein
MSSSYQQPPDPISPSYTPSSPPTSPQRTSLGSSSVGRPSYFALKRDSSLSKTYQAAAALMDLKAGITYGAHAANNANAFDKEGNSPASKRSGMRVLREPSYTKKPIPGETVTTETSEQHNEVAVSSTEEGPGSNASVSPENNTSDVHQSKSFHPPIKLKVCFKPGFEHITVLKPGQTNSTTQKDTAAAHKFTAASVVADDSEFTDSDMDINPVARKKNALAPLSKKAKVTASKKASTKTKATFNKDKDGDAIMSDDDSVASEDDFILMQPSMKRKDCIVDPNNAADAALIAAATKAGADIYDSDAEDLPNTELKGTKQKTLFRNVNWGAAASDYRDAAAFPVNPVFTQFVPGRWERQPDGTVVDQKHKLLVKLTDQKGKQRIFKNPPPADWANQAAITALNKRTVQQIRRTTMVRFRKEVVPYVQEERRWILAHLKDGKPETSWVDLVAAFNKQFQGVVVAGSEQPRPARSHSSLSKEVERFGAKFYSKGLVPSPAQAK